MRYNMKRWFHLCNGNTKESHCGVLTVEAGVGPKGENHQPEHKLVYPLLG